MSKAGARPSAPDTVPVLYFDALKPVEQGQKKQGFLHSMGLCLCNSRDGTSTREQNEVYTKLGYYVTTLTYFLTWKRGR
ncbi:hypothetical protein [Brevibacillus laterosporus]|uniref:hypothetical protein n=1 Tax=Brevibacillus laterosporus TaxID=1465 RepID=UPI00114063F5|nr:hypothetical protein [Brevibacillus laterosporus]